ncbi:hypothetical protein [Streptomyces rishiriensis]|uniref:Uncharacterized protein n=1 Tax=Streptomyces rishiriensis TaxID=68264 RepID=A0ABU0NH16_STRRH|nr:hypothetical protein [Streptomyces rishiriensis]MDQ0578389.1 hypothetical protein [Streptomyces rishiriensis]
MTDPELDTLVGRLATYWPGRIHAVAELPLEVSDLAVNVTPLGLRSSDPLPFRPKPSRPQRWWATSS